MVMATELKHVFHMNGGSDDTSYAKSSYIQKQLLTLTKPLKEQAIRDSYCKNLPKTMCIADLGCSSAESNTLSLITELLDTIEKAHREHGNEPQEYQVYLNDLPGNDFNTIFRSLGKFEDKLKKKMGDDFGHCFVSGVPGSFYGRLFPSNHLHFVHSYSIHWLSQIPKGIENNKENVYISRTSPSNVVKAYSDQFENDFTTFLRRRSEEVVAGGMMVLTMLGRKTEELYSKESCYMYDLLATALNSMVFEGLIDEEKLNTYNIPQYPPSAAELRNLVDKQGSFSFDQVHVCEVSWEANECYKYSSSKESDHYDFYKCMRSVVEPLLTSHFGETIIEEIFKRYKDLIQNAMALENNVFINVTISLTRKG